MGNGGPERYLTLVRTEVFGFFLEQDRHEVFSWSDLSSKHHSRIGGGRF
jgi:hypothetical protein